MSRRWPTCTICARRDSRNARPLQSGSPSPTARSSAAAPSVKRLQPRDRQRQMRAALVDRPRREFRRRSACAPSAASCATSRPSAECTATRAWSPECAALSCPSAGAPRREYRRCAPRSDGASGRLRRPASAAIPASGISRFLWTSLLSALSGETYRTCASDPAARPRSPGAHQIVEGDQERRQRLARTGGRGDQHIAPGGSPGQPKRCGSVTSRTAG